MRACMSGGGGRCRCVCIGVSNGRRHLPVRRLKHSGNASLRFQFSFVPRDGSKMKRDRESGWVRKGEESSRQATPANAVVHATMGQWTKRVGLANSERERSIEARQKQRHRRDCKWEWGRRGVQKEVAEAVELGRGRGAWDWLWNWDLAVCLYCCCCLGPLEVALNSNESPFGCHLTMATHRGRSTHRHTHTYMYISAQRVESVNLIWSHTIDSFC